METHSIKPGESGLRRHVYEVIFEHDSPLGKRFDVLLLLAIVVSVMTVMLESVASIRAAYPTELRAIEWFFTILFTVEYLSRLYCVSRPSKYVFSFFGIVDFLAIAPTYLSLFFVGTQYLTVVRALRLLRIFRVLKMGQYIGEENILMGALSKSRRKITVFLIAVINLVLVIGALIHLIEGPENGFTSIPISIYWAIVTLTTVGYGDIAPQTVIGQCLASGVMIIGYAIIAVPTGIVTAEMARANEDSRTSGLPICPSCSHKIAESAARFCSSCGAMLTS